MPPPAKPDPHAAALHAIADGLQSCAQSLESVAYAIQRLGNGNAATQMGAIEAFAATLKEALDSSADTISLAIQAAAQRQEN